MGSCVVGTFPVDIAVTAGLNQHRVHTTAAAAGSAAGGAATIVLLGESVASVQVSVAVSIVQVGQATTVLVVALRLAVAVTDALLGEPCPAARCTLWQVEE